MAIEDIIKETQEGIAIIKATEIVTISNDIVIDENQIKAKIAELQAELDKYTQLLDATKGPDTVLASPPIINPVVIP